LEGAAAVELIKQALEAPGVYVFGELLDMANVQVVTRIHQSPTCPGLIQDLENGPHASHLALIKMFAYGNYRSLGDNKDNFPELSEAMTRKLRLLTMVTLNSFQA
jgi:COP9 signalosome complex subunit 7